MKVLFVKLSSLGDVVHTLPALQDVRRHVSGVQVDWVVERAFAPLVARCEGVGRIIPSELRQWRKSPLHASTRKAWGAFRAELQATAYDAVVDLQGLSKSALVAWLARLAPRGRRIAMAHATEGSGYEAPTRWVADEAITLPTHVHAVERGRLLCAAAFGYTVEGLPHYGLVPGPQAVPQPAVHPANALAARQAGTSANPFVPRKAVVALVHGSSRADKQWPLAHWVELGRRLNHSGFAVALAHGNAAEKATSEAIARELTDAWVWPSMALDALTDTMAHCAAVVGVDSGLSHIAVALGLPHVQIYNFDTAWRTGPQGAAAPTQRVARQCSVFASPHPDVDAVWRAWEELATPVLCQ